MARLPLVGTACPRGWLHRRSQRSAGTFRTRHEAERAGTAAEIRMAEGSWVDRQAGRITFTDYVERHWWPSRHLEISTRAAYRSNLDRHFLPFFGGYPLAEITPSLVQTWSAPPSTAACRRGRW